MTDAHLLRILNSPDWNRRDRLDILRTHPQFHTAAAAVIERLRQQPGYAAALQWCQKLKPCRTVYMRSPFSTEVHRLFQRDTDTRVQREVFELAASDAGLPVDIPSGRERLRVGAHRLGLRRIEQRVAERPYGKLHQH